MTENVPNLVKETDIQVQEAQRVPKKLDPKRNTPRYIIIKLSKIKGKGENLKITKRQLPTKECPKDYQLISQKELYRQKGLERSIQSHERQGLTSKIPLSSKAFI